jgi:hypothetical protein
MSITILQLQKRASYKYENIQDKFAFNEVNKSFALADGTTQSFNSEKWAELITKTFVADPTFESEKIISKFTDCVQVYKNEKFEFSSNPAKASLEKTKQQKGGTATFIGIQFLENNRFSIIGCGDTNFFIVKNNAVEGFPFSEIEKLNANTSFINTEQLLQNKIDKSFFQIKEFQFHDSAIYILATDALSRLLLKNVNLISELTAIDSFQKLHDFCIKYWEKKEMEEDDISAIIIKKDTKRKIKKILPPPEFSFPKEEEPEFTPASLTQLNNLNQLTDMQMQEIIRQFNGVANDFRQIKKKQKFHEMLIMVAISLIIMNFLYLIFFQTSSPPEINRNDFQQQLQQQLNDKENTIKNQQKKIDKLNEQLQTKDTSQTKGDLKPVNDISTKSKSKDAVTLKKEDKVPLKKEEKKQSLKPQKAH